MKKCELVFLLILFTFTSNPSFIGHAQAKGNHADSSYTKNSLKLDLIPFYYDLFDNRIQARIGLEYERAISKRSALTCYLDAGLYDKYSYIKYYDFFNQNQGIYNTEQKVLITGFHLSPGYNWYFCSFGKNEHNRLFAGALADLGYYQKGIVYSNSLTSETRSDSYHQVKLGLGASLGFKRKLSSHFFAEVKTSLISKVINSVESGQNTISSLDAQWTSPDHNFWWITHLKIGYAF